MNDDRPVDFSMISSILAGLAGGILMGAVLIAMMRSEGYQLWTLSFWVIMVAGCMLPWCLDFLRIRGLHLRVAEYLMICVSLVLAIVYGLMVASNGPVRAMILTCGLILHIGSAGVTGIRLYIRERDRSDYR